MSRPHRPWHALEPRETSHLTAMVACAGTTSEDTEPPFIYAEFDEIVCSVKALAPSINHQSTQARGPSFELFNCLRLRQGHALLHV
jgi:hypothetical protein